MHAALLVVDMVEANFRDEHALAVTPHARVIVPRINELTEWARDRKVPVIFACDSFLEEDFIFKGKMKPHSLRGTPDCEVFEGLVREASDVCLPKRRFSAFFKTDLDQTLRTLGLDTVIVCGITTQFCVLATALDALCHDFRAVIVEDATASHSPEVHEQTLDHYRNTPLYPLLRVMKAGELLKPRGRNGR